jgi:hypothetical protein
MDFRDGIPIDVDGIGLCFIQGLLNQADVLFILDPNGSNRDSWTVLIASILCAIGSFCFLRGLVIIMESSISVTAMIATIPTLAESDIVPSLMVTL